MNASPVKAGSSSKRMDRQGHHRSSQGREKPRRPPSRNRNKKGASLFRDGGEPSVKEQQKTTVDYRLFLNGPRKNPDALALHPLLGTYQLPTTWFYNSAETSGSSSSSSASASEGEVLFSSGRVPTLFDEHHDDPKDPYPKDPFPTVNPANRAGTFLRDVKPFCSPSGPSPLSTSSRSRASTRNARIDADSIKTVGGGEEESPPVVPASSSRRSRSSSRQRRRTVVTFHEDENNKNKEDGARGGDDPSTTYQQVRDLDWTDLLKGRGNISSSTTSSCRGPTTNQTAGSKNHSGISSSTRKMKRKEEEESTEPSTSFGSSSSTSRREIADTIQGALQQFIERRLELAEKAMAADAGWNGGGLPPAPQQYRTFFPIPGLNLEDAPKSKECRNLKRQAERIAQDVRKCEEEMYDLMDALEVVQSAEQNELQMSGNAGRRRTTTRGSSRSSSSATTRTSRAGAKEQASPASRTRASSGSHAGGQEESKNKNNIKAADRASSGDPHPSSQTNNKATSSSTSSPRANTRSSMKQRSGVSRWASRRSARGSRSRTGSPRAGTSSNLNRESREILEDFSEGELDETKLMNHDEKRDHSTTSRGDVEMAQGQESEKESCSPVKRRWLEMEQHRRENPFHQERQQKELNRLRKKYYGNWVNSPDDQYLRDPATGRQLHKATGIIRPAEPERRDDREQNMAVELDHEVEPSARLADREELWTATVRGLDVLGGSRDGEGGQRKASPSCSSSSPRATVAMAKKSSRDERIRASLENLASPLKRELLRSRSLSPEKKREILRQSLGKHLESNQNSMLESQEVLRMLYGESMEAADFLDALVREQKKKENKEKEAKQVGPLSQSIFELFPNDRRVGGDSKSGAPLMSLSATRGAGRNDLLVVEEDEDNHVGNVDDFGEEQKRLGRQHDLPTSSCTSSSRGGRAAAPVDVNVNKGSRLRQPTRTTSGTTSSSGHQQSYSSSSQHPVRTGTLRSRGRSPPAHFLGGTATRTSAFHDEDDEMVIYDIEEEQEQKVHDQGSSSGPNRNMNISRQQRPTKNFSSSNSPTSLSAKNTNAPPNKKNKPPPTEPSQKLKKQMTNALKLLQETAFLITDEGQAFEMEEQQERKARAAARGRRS
ncbi:unnamed protein product [Amoebophrya sp. A25]|nr:unnamed protein product [Amoebophrya sp. A25]|eukprot:GSA25T00004705001.1